MTYTTNIPISGDTLGGTRDRVRTNFQQIQDLIAKNHEDFGSILGQGKHKFLQLPEQASAPTTAVNEGGFYTKVGTNPAETNIFFRAEDSGGGGGFEYQLTKAISASTGRFATSPNGWTFLPGGLILQWGTKTNPGTSGSIVFATSNIVFPTSIIQVMLQLYHNSAANESATVQAGAPPTQAGFDYRTTSSSPNTILKWFAIGL